MPEGTPPTWQQTKFAQATAVQFLRSAMELLGVTSDGLAGFRAMAGSVGAKGVMVNIEVADSLGVTCAQICDGLITHMEERTNIIENLFDTGD